MPNSIDARGQECRDSPHCLQSTAALLQDLRDAIFIKKRKEFNAFQWSCESRDSLLGPEPLGETAVTEADAWELDAEIRVSEQGFGRPDALVFDTLDLVPVWQGYAFPWC